MENKLLIQDLADAIALKEGCTKKKSEAFIKALFETIEEGLLTDKFTKVKGLGTFKIISVGERESVNINTGERFSIEGHNKVTFTPDTLIKDLVNRPFAHFQTVVINDETNVEELEQIDNAPEIGESFPEEKEVFINTVVEKEEETSEASSLEIDENFQQDNHRTSIATTDIKGNGYTLQTESNQDELEREGNTFTSTPENQGMTEDKSNNDISKEAIDVIPSKEANLGEELTSTKQDEDNDVTKIAHEKDQSLKESVLNNADKEDEENLQKIHNETTHPEQIQYIIKEAEHKKNIWKTISLILAALLILFLTYFAGYFRLFCPCEFMGQLTSSGVIDPFIASDGQIRTSTVSTTRVAKDTINADSICSHQTIKTKDSLRLSSNTPIPSSLLTTKTTNKQIPQVQGAKYKITGTRKEHQIKSGETIRNIALKEYGSKGYAIYIITYNQIENPNNVAVGTTIRLPELTKN